MERPRHNAADTLAVIQRQAAEKYGADATFTYLRDGTAYTLTLPEAVRVCGEHIADADSGTVWTTLDKMYRLAQGLKTAPERYERSVRLGKEVMKRRGV